MPADFRIVGSDCGNYSDHSRGTNELLPTKEMRPKEGHSKVQEELEFDPYRGYQSCGGPFSTETSHV